MDELAPSTTYTMAQVCNEYVASWRKLSTLGRGAYKMTHSDALFSDANLRHGCDTIMAQVCTSHHCDTACYSDGASFGKWRKFGRSLGKNGASCLLTVTEVIRYRCANHATYNVQHVALVSIGARRLASRRVRGNRATEVAQFGADLHACNRMQMAWLTMKTGG